MKNKAAVFFVIPLFLFVFLAIALNEITHFYFGWYDPVYAYLMNGLTFALGSFDIGHTDHPGTPLQFFCAIIIRLTGFFRGTNDLATDVLTHTELYVFVISSVLIFINGIALFVLGFNAYKVTRNKWFSLLIQLSPLLAFVAILFMPVLATETVLVFSSVLLASLIIFHENSENKRCVFKLLIMSFLSGLIVATKISALPVLAVPFFFFKGWKQKMIYVFASVVFLFLLLLPVLPKMDRFIEFIHRIFSHTGKYGSGEEAIIDWPVYFVSLKKLLFEEIPFLINILLLVFGWWLVVIKKQIDAGLRRILLGLSVATLTGILVVARHYSFHYLIPVYVISMPLQVFFLYSYLQKNHKHINLTKYYWLVGLVILFVFVRIVIKYHFYPGMKTPVVKTVKVIENEKLGPFIIMSHTSKGTAFIEPALNFGLAYSGTTMRKEYRQIISKNYPENYLWNIRNGFFDWTGNQLVYELFSKHKTLFIYNRLNNCELAFTEIVKLLDNHSLINFVDVEKVYTNSVSGEVIVKVENDTAVIRNFLKPVKTVHVTMEKRTTDGKQFVDESGEELFDGGISQSAINVYEGDYSIMLTSLHKFGLKTELFVKPNEMFRLEAWQKSSSGSGAVFVASAPDSKYFYKTSHQKMKDQDNWFRDEFFFQVPRDYKYPSVNCYLYLPEGDTVWVDELKVERFFYPNVNLVDSLNNGKAFPD
ncbi:MAG: hypothetical protein K9H26_08575 [Prolixibacteraceae bacterium]|nr:hypothetical protein [Prolixibacteraceae bacterium]